MTSPSCRFERRTAGIASDSELGAIDRVFLMENHDEAYRIWREAGLKQRTLIHIDAHHDMFWMPESTSITIGNFISLALREDLIGEVYWVVPDATFESMGNRKVIFRHLQALAKSYPRLSPGYRAFANEMSTIVLGRPLRVCTLGNLPRIEENVLLDIDVDYMVIPRVSYQEIDQHSCLPWCWPDDLVARLKTCKLRADLVTIAYSVEGGYTPLKWKYLGEELALRLTRSEGREERVRGLDRIREAAVAAYTGERATALEKYEEARKLLPDCAAPCFHLAHLFAEMGRTTDARAFHQRALEMDPSYRTPYNCAGLSYYAQMRFQEAEKEYLRALELDPTDAYAYFGLGHLALRRKCWQEAEAHLRKSLALNAQLTEAYRSLGEALSKQGRCEEAIVAYERSLKLALAGHRPLEAPIATLLGPGRPSDPNHFFIHACLARLYARRGDLSRAINGYRMSIAGGRDGVLPRSSLAHLLLKQGEWSSSAQEAWNAVKKVPGDLGKASRQIHRRLRRAIRARYNKKLREKVIRWV